MAKMSQTKPVKHDYSTWYLKQQAAEAIGISTKQLDRWANEKRLQRVKWRRPAGGPVLNVYHPGDVDRLAQSRNQVGAFVLPDGDPPATNGAHAVAVRQPSAEQFLEALATAVSGMSRMSETCQTVRLAERVYLTIGEAVEYTGLGSVYLRRQVAVGNLDLVKGAGPHGADVLRRADLDKL